MTNEESLYRIWLRDRVDQCLEHPSPDYAGPYNCSEKDLELSWEWTNRMGAVNCWATEIAKVAGWVRLLLIDLEIAKRLPVEDSDTFADRICAMTKRFEPFIEFEQDGSTTISWPLFQRNGKVLTPRVLADLCDLDRELFAVVGRQNVVLCIPEEVAS